MKLLSILFIAVIGLAASEAFTRDRRQAQNFQPFGAGFPFQPLPFPAVPVGGAGQGQGTFVSTSQSLNSRFGDDEPVVSGQTTVIHQKDGKYEQHNYQHRPDGTVGQTHSSGRVKRQQNQSQLQDGGNGANQQQTQSQGQPGGQQFQAQSQGPSATPAAGNQQTNQNSIPQYDDRNQQGNDQFAQGQQYPQGGGQQYPQGGGQQYPQGGGQQYPQGGGQQYPQGGGQQYPQGNSQNPGFGFSPFGFGSFGPGGFGAAPFPQAGFAPGFAGFPFPQQPAFGFPAGNIPPGAAQGPQSGFSGSRIDSRFSDDDSGSVAGGTQTFSSNNGVYHSTTSVLGPDGKVHTHKTSGRHQ